ncbi:TylF/MycF/NovP-related O-methyltransferase [Kiloniella sp.]|uniref:TylF/MycF/NovP-related O-methyltransferase n=1 Tax=Kiloniella sp. TaxID=1938587 RepID=UPI003A95B29D
MLLKKIHEELLSEVTIHPNRLQHLVDSAATSKFFGYSMEFGVYKGDTLNHLATNHPAETFWGFDSFCGLPEKWYLSHDKKNVVPKNWFALDELPKTAENVKLAPGWFDDALPSWLEKNEGPVSFAHMDCNLYSSTKTVLTHLDARIVTGTILVFDELQHWEKLSHEYAYETWQEGEWKALSEWVHEYNRNITPLSRTKHGQAAFRVLE